MDMTSDSMLFLSAVDVLGGAATTPELRVETGLSRDKIHYQYTKLHDMGYIDISYADSGVGKRNPPKIATITPTGTERLENYAGELAEEDVTPHLQTDEVVLKRSDFVELIEANEELQRRLNVVEQKQSELLDFETSTVDLMQRRYDYLDELNKRVIALSRWRNEVNHYLLACEFAFNTINFDFDKAMDVVSEDIDYNDEGLQTSHGTD